MDVFHKELEYKTNLKHWEFLKNVDSVDRNIISRFNNNDLIQIKWNAEFYSYGIGFEHFSDIVEEKDLSLIIERS